MYYFSKHQKIIGVSLLAFILLADLIYLNLETISSNRRINEVANQSVSLSSPSESISLQKASLATDCCDLKEASQYVGEEVCVEGKLDHLYTSQTGTVFLNFCPNYQDCSFQAVIFQSDANKFSNLKNYTGKTIQITGLVKTYLGKPEIIINDPTQIKVK